MHIFFNIFATLKFSVTDIVYFIKQFPLLPRKVHRSLINVRLSHFFFFFQNFWEAQVGWNPSGPTFRKFENLKYHFPVQTPQIQAGASNCDLACMNQLLKFNPTLESSLPDAPRGKFPGSLSSSSSSVSSTDRGAGQPDPWLWDLPFSPPPEGSPQRAGQTGEYSTAEVIGKRLLLQF